jgi:hypothetical protein
VLDWVVVVDVFVVDVLEVAVVVLEVVPQLPISIMNAITKINGMASHFLMFSSSNI